MTGPAPISVGQLAIAAMLLVCNAGLSWVLSLGLGKRLLVAAARTLVQLSLLGFVLVPIFEAHDPALTLGLGLVMIVLASAEGLKRVRLRYTGARLDSFVALFVAAVVTTIAGTHVVIGIDPWWEPRYLIPLLGMILGNALSGISLGLDRCLEQIRAQRSVIEASLALGATRWEAGRPVVVDALRTGMIPILNSMSVVGLVTIPGMMTGQLLGGTPPWLAARYQIVIMFLIASATAIGVFLAVAFGVRRLFDADHRLLVHRLTERDR